jgi:hypothetical protein
MPISRLAVVTDNRWLLRMGKALGLVTTMVTSLDGKVDLDDPAIESRLVSDARRRIAYLHGLYFLAHRSFMESREKIKEMFRIQEGLWAGVKETLARCRSRGDVVVGFHVRYGDYVGAKDDMVFSLDEYRLLARQVQELFHPKKIVLLLCTGDPIKPSEFYPHEVVAAPGRYVQDLHCLANSDVIVGPPSTYSQWASFYGDVPVFNVNSINERKHGFPVSVRSVDGFNVQVSGCSRHSVRRAVNLHELGLI